MIDYGEQAAQNHVFIKSGLEVNRIGFGAMRITGPQVYGIPETRRISINSLRRAVELGVNFIDTADQYGPFTSQQLFAEAQHPCADVKMYHCSLHLYKSSCQTVSSFASTIKR